MVRILFVCTANRCRSVMAEFLAERTALARDLHEVELASAGRLDSGREAVPESAAAVAYLGGDASSHRSRTIDAELVTAADLVLTMDVRHLEDCAVLRPDGLRRVFLLAEFAERAERVGSRSDGQAVAEYLDRVGAGRTAAQVLRDGPRFEVADPIGLPVQSHIDCARDIDAHVSAVLHGLWPAPVPARKAVSQ